MSFKSYFLLGVLFIFLLGSCSKNEDKVCADSFNFSVELQAEATNISAATNAYVTDQSKANCDAFVKAYEDYLDAAKGLEDCADAVGQGAEFIQAIQEAEAAIENFECN